MKKFLKDLEKELRKIGVSEKDITEILEDHIEMIESGKAEGLNEDNMNTKFGNPKNIAEEIYNDSKGTANLGGFTEHAMNCTIDIDESEYTQLQRFSTFGNELKNIDINLIAETIIVKTHSSDDIVVLYKNMKKVDKYSVSFNKGKLELRRKKQLNTFLFSFDNKNESFIVVIPETAVINDYIVNTVSGNIIVDNIVTTDLKFKTVSGDVNSSNIITKHLKVTTVSGNSHLASLKAKSLILSQVSGDSTIKAFTIEGDIEANSVSGDINLNNGTNNNFVLNCVSGGVNAFEYYPKAVSLKSVSGNINITNNNKDHSIDIKRVSSVSGKINIL